MSGVNRVLFDAPGPRARRRIAVATVVSVLVMAGVVVLGLVQFGRNGQLVAAKWTYFTQAPILRFLLSGIGTTGEVAAVCAVLALPLGAVLALGRMSDSRVLKAVCVVFIEFFRSVPLLMVIYIFLLAVPKSGYTFPVFWQLVIPIVLCSGAVLAEVFRAGVMALDSGQSEAAYALGMKRRQVMWIVVFPQAIRLVVPTLVSQLVSLLKDSTLGYAVSVAELLNQAKDLSSYTHYFIQSYTVVAVVYILVNAAISQFAHALERRARRKPRAGGVVPDPDGTRPATELDSETLRVA
ncbi:amino acid ABC transporter permease [Streptomyces sp. SL13]|jgi:glutamate transport system permease protein|uniref:Amino acid ABC transporter permease n=1 Tax=Streptantibioticus silvisoli TaxID=2705255 RepID=A0AA90H8B9_9ACTN|nr:amino acid ABC transporter permease [Streptantibioticus silvisoli]MDI5972364.1 amino acid ABC transporter permease [Streptantibioticus silvisoli]